MDNYRVESTGNTSFEQANVVSTTVASEDIQINEKHYDRYPQIK